ncbi:unnamed protein product [Cladocopium goreaui]|uniref:Uncharacterized protein n=1 Tax=Cladocopium goreaui TaxID=2562237 RepID=A0A9P1D3Y6_9DINO|nr:unnamed protein product [Cladocopium goreaui]
MSAGGCAIDVPAVVLNPKMGMPSQDVAEFYPCGAGRSFGERRQVCSRLCAVADQAGSTGWQDAIQLLAEAQRQRSASMEAFEDAAELCRIQDAPRAAPRVEKLLEEARQSKLNPTRRLYEAVVMSYGDAESWEQALFWLLEAGAQGAQDAGELDKPRNPEK